MSELAIGKEDEKLQFSKEAKGGGQKQRRDLSRRIQFQFSPEQQQEQQQQPKEQQTNHRPVMNSTPCNGSGKLATIATKWRFAYGFSYELGQ